MNHISIPEGSSSPSIAPSSTSPSAQEARQKLLQSIYEYNTDGNTPPDLRFHITGLSLEEGAIFESDLTLVTEDPESRTPAVSSSDSPSPSIEAVPDTDILLLKASEPLEELETDHDASKSKEEISRLLAQEIKIRDLKREKDTLEMEGRRRAAEEQVNARWQERALKDLKENTKIDYRFVRGVDSRDDAIITSVQYPNDGSGSREVPDENRNRERIKYNVGRGEHIIQEVVIDRDVRNSGGERQVEEGKTKKSSPKAPKGLRQLAGSRRKTNKEWVAKQGQRLAVRENDASTRNDLLMGVNRAIAIAEGVALKGAERLIDFAKGDRVWKTTTEVVDKGKHKDSRARVGYSHAYPRLGYAPPLPTRPENDFKPLLGKERENWPAGVEERGRRKAYHTPDSSLQPQESERHIRRHHVRSDTDDLPKFHHQERRASEDSRPFNSELSPPQAPPLHRHEHANEAVKGDVPRLTIHLVQAAEEQTIINFPREDLPIPPMSPLVPKVANSLRLEPLPPIVFPVKAIRDSRPVRNKNPEPRRSHAIREKALADFEKSKVKYQEESKAVKSNLQAGPIKGILKRDGKGKGKAITWVDEPTDNEEDDEMSSIKHTPSFNERADQEELKKLDDKRQRQSGRFRCLATVDKIEEQNLAARERAEVLADTIMRGGGGTEDFQEVEEK